jgi:hypothetical protein
MNTFLQYLTEATQRPDLKQLYRELNDKYFDGELPDINLKYTNLRRAIGRAKAHIEPDQIQYWPKSKDRDKFTRDEIKQKRELKIDGIVVTTAHDFTREQLIGVLLHEMIHVWFYHNGDIWETHGELFMKKRQELMEASGIDIPASESMEEYAYADDVQFKPVIAALSPKNPTFLNVINNNTNMRELFDISVRYQHRYEFYRVSLPELHKYPVKRASTAMKKLHMGYAIPPDLSDEIKARGKKITNHMFYEVSDEDLARELGPEVGKLLAKHNKG